MSGLFVCRCLTDWHICLLTSSFVSVGLIIFHVAKPFSIVIIRGTNRQRSMETDEGRLIIFSLGGRGSFDGLYHRTADRLCGYRSNVHRFEEFKYQGCGQCFDEVKEREEEQVDKC